MPFVQKEELGKPSHIVETLKLFVIMRAGLPKAKAGGASLFAVGKKKTPRNGLCRSFSRIETGSRVGVNGSLSYW